MQMEDGYVASGDDDGELIVWHGDTGKSLIQAIQAHSDWVWSLDFSRNGAALATGSRVFGQNNEAVEHQNLALYNVNPIGGCNAGT
jgi:WD40 repeat protein